MAQTCQMTEAMRDVCERAMAAEAEPMLDGISGRTAPPERPRDEGGRQDGPEEEREEIPSHFGSRPANAYLEGQTLTRSVKRVARGLRNVEYLATAIFPGLGGYRSTPSLALHPSPCYPPETPKSRNSELFRGSCGLTPRQRRR